MQRKVGPGQYVNSGASDPVFVIGDLSDRLAHRLRPRDRCRDGVGRAGDRRSTCWRCRAAPLTAHIDYVSAAIDPATRRLLVRATIDNKDGLLKPEMFANVTIYSAGDHPAVGVPKQA